MVIVVDSKHLPWLDLTLHAKVEPLFFVILSPSNEVQSWNDIKTDLKLFFDYALFKSAYQKIERVRLVSIQRRFRQWLQEKLLDDQLSNASFKHWTLQIAIAFTFQEYLDTTLSKSYDWEIGLYLEFDPDYVEELINRNTIASKLKVGHQCRAIHRKYAVYECMAINKIAVLFQNEWTLKHTDNYLKKYYGDS